MRLEEWRQTGSYFKNGDLPVFYRLSRENDEVLLCLHGFPTASYDYRKIWRALAEKFAVFSFDMLGYGFSAKPISFNYTTFAQADILQGLLEFLGIKRVHILAHDYGNTITQELLAREKERRLGFTIETICFLNGALFPETHRPILAQKLLLSRVGSVFGQMIPDWAFKKSLASVFGAGTNPSEEELEDYVELFKFNGGKRIAHKLIRYMTERTTFRERWVSPLQTMEQPFLFINGSADPVSGAHLVNRFVELVPHQTNIVELPEIGHFPHLEASEIVLERFFEFHQAINPDGYHQTEPFT